jgi:hypothetical protein
MTGSGKRIGTYDPTFPERSGVAIYIGHVQVGFIYYYGVLCQIALIKIG